MKMTFFENVLQQFNAAADVLKLSDIDREVLTIPNKIITAFSTTPHSGRSRAA